MYAHAMPLGGTTNPGVAYQANGSMLNVPAGGFQHGNQQMLMPNAGFQVMQQPQQMNPNLNNAVAAPVQTSVVNQPNIPNQMTASMPPAAQRPPMQRDHFAIQRMQQTAFPRPGISASQKPAWHSGATGPNSAKRQLPEANGSAAKKVRSSDTENEAPVEHLRKLLRTKADAMMKRNRRQQPFNEMTAYELTKVKADFEEMFGYSLDSKLNRKAKISELVFRHANDIMCLRATKTRGTMLIPAGERFQEGAAATETGGDAGNLTSPSTPSKRLVVPPATPLQEKPGTVQQPEAMVEATVDLTEDTDNESPKATTAEPTADKPAAPAPAAQPTPAAILPLFRCKLSSACFYVSKEAEYLLKSDFRRQMLKVTLQPAMKTVEQAMKCKEYKQHVSKVQFEKALPMLALYQDIAAAVHMDWETVQETIDTECQSNVMLSNAATISMSKDGMAILFPSYRGLKAYSTIKDVVALLAEQLLPLTPSAIKPSPDPIKLDKFQQDFQQKNKYKVDAVMLGYPTLKELLESELLKQYVDVVAGPGSGNWVLKPKFDPLQDVRSFLEARMLDLIEIQKQEGNFRLPHEKGLKPDALKADFPLEYLYDINCVPIGFPDFPALISANHDICELREERGKPVRVHPSPLLHLKLLLQASVQGATPILDDKGVRVPNVNPEDGYSIADIVEDFQGIYEYPLNLSQFGLGSITEALNLLQDVCATLVGKDKQTYMFPPKKDAQNGFVMKLRAKLGKKESNTTRTVTSPTTDGKSFKSKTLVNTPSTTARPVGQGTSGPSTARPAGQGTSGPSTARPAGQGTSGPSTARPAGQGASGPSTARPAGQGASGPTPTHAERTTPLAPTRVMTSARVPDSDRAFRQPDANRGSAYGRGQDNNRYVTPNRTTPGTEPARANPSTRPDTTRYGNRATPERTRPPQQQHQQQQQHEMRSGNVQPYGVGSSDAKVMQPKQVQPAVQQHVQQHPQQFMLSPANFSTANAGQQGQQQYGQLQSGNMQGPAGQQGQQQQQYGQAQARNMQGNVTAGGPLGMQMGAGQQALANSSMAQASGTNAAQPALPPGFGGSGAQQVQGGTALGAAAQGLNGQTMGSGGQQGSTGTGMQMGGGQFRLQGPGGTTDASSGQGGGASAGAAPGGFMGGGMSMPTLGLGLGSGFMSGMGNNAQQLVGGMQGGPAVLVMSNQNQNTAAGAQQAQGGQQQPTTMQAGQTFMAMNPQMQNAAKTQQTAANVAAQGQAGAANATGMMGMAGMMGNMVQSPGLKGPQGSMPQSSLTNMGLQPSQQAGAPAAQGYQQVYAVQQQQPQPAQQQQQHAMANQPTQQQQQPQYVVAMGNTGNLAAGSLGMGMMANTGGAAGNMPSMSGYPAAGNVSMMSGQQGMQQPSGQANSGYQQGMGQMGQGAANGMQSNYLMNNTYGQNSQQGVPRMSGYGQ